MQRNKISVQYSSWCLVALHPVGNLSHIEDWIDQCSTGIIESSRILGVGQKKVE